MTEPDNLKVIQSRCQEVLRSPYSFRPLPTELHRLQDVMTNANALARTDVPNLLAEVKRLRAQVVALKKQIG